MPVPFSAKQRAAMSWWYHPKTRRLDAVICDGAVRSGKTTALSLGFVLWASCRFQGQSFALCGRTVTAVRRNLVRPLTALLSPLGFDITEKVSRNYLDIRFQGHENRFYLFGGKDEASAPLIQGITLAGVLLDEVALMPRSFVEQALARCSVAGAKLWFSCNPDKPSHWFYREWILQAAQKHALYLHFTMDDNPSLSPSVRARYERLYTGAFYDRYVRGIWAAANGLCYPMFDEKLHVAEPPCEPERYAVSCDYGTMNPCSFGLWGLCRGCWYRIAEDYYDARRSGLPRTDEEHYRTLCSLAGDRPIDTVVVDPSAASFIACIRRHGKFRVVPAKNDVLAGIHRTADALRSGEIKIAPCCTDAIREFSLYQWDARAQHDAPLKENDHAMDDIRYFVTTVADAPRGGCFALSVRR
ncbi:MAG: PBSX family phage terminase large subunit [Oscillospiraceae bacterium]|nr:PBSX family phage terminase large subunit [Oscillospiraceae bacterium]